MAEKRGRPDWVALIYQRFLGPGPSIADGRAIDRFRSHQGLALNHLESGEVEQTLEHYRTGMGYLAGVDKPDRERLAASLLLWAACLDVALLRILLRKADQAQSALAIARSVIRDELPNLIERAETTLSGFPEAQEWTDEALASMSARHFVDFDTAPAIGWSSYSTEPLIAKPTVPSKLRPSKAEVTKRTFAKKEERLQHFAGRTKWKAAKAKDPDLTPVQHIINTYPDRRLGLLRADLNDKRLDPDLYAALRNWLNYKRPDGVRPHKLPADFGLPTVEEFNTALLKEKGVPTGAEVFAAFRRGDPAAVEMNRLYAAGQRRKSRKSARLKTPNS